MTIILCLLIITECIVNIIIKYQVIIQWRVSIALMPNSYDHTSGFYSRCINQIQVID